MKLGRKYKLKLQSDTKGRNLIGWLKQKNLTIQSAHKDRSNSPVVMQHGKATLENHLAVSYKTKHTPKLLANPFLGILQ